MMSLCHSMSILWLIDIIVCNSYLLHNSPTADVLGDLKFAQAYIDNILIMSSATFEDHVSKVDAVLSRLAEAGFVVNVNKSHFAMDQIDYLGYWLTRDGIQPQHKKVEAIQRLEPPKTKHQLRKFLGMINYYRNMWQRRSHILAPLTAMVSNKAKFVWDDTCQKAFDKIKEVISRETQSSHSFIPFFHIFYFFIRVKNMMRYKIGMKFFGSVLWPFFGLSFDIYASTLSYANSLSVTQK